MDKKEIIRQFESPGNAHRGKPFWSWNGALKKEELLRQVDVLKEMGFGGFFMHSRAGLITEYLGDEWFELINAVADKGAKQGMEVWLYDEDRWPSGSAGGKATLDPQYRMQSLVLYETAAECYVPDDTDFAVFAAETQAHILYAYQRLQVGMPLPAELPSGSKILVYRVVKAKPESVYNGATYLDTLSRAATDNFIRITHEAYKQHCGDRIGTTIRGIFTDEPHRGHLLDDLHEEDGAKICSIAYTDDIFEEFEKRYGYDAVPLLPELFYQKDGTVLARVKHDFVDLANALFLERFVQPINRWCEDNHMQLTGHFLHEDSLSAQTSPLGSLMRGYEHMGIPGIDILSEHNHCYWAAKQLSSVCRQAGKKWMLSELYGCTGWHFDFKGHKTVGDWQALFGINVRCPHLSWYTMEGESKRDYPASILHQSSYYKDYKYIENYFARFGLVMQQGAPLCDVLVINPIESIWSMIRIGWAKWVTGQSPEVVALEKHYADLFHMLVGNHIDFDYGDEDMLARLSAVEKTADGAALRVGEMTYRTVVVSGALTLRRSTCRVLRQFLESGGQVIFAGEVPAFVDAEPCEEVLQLSACDGATCVPFEENALVQAVRVGAAFAVSVTDASDNVQHDIFVQARLDEENGNVYIALLNTDLDTAKSGLQLTVTVGEKRFAAAEEWVLTDGSRYTMPMQDGEQIVLQFDMESAEEKVFVLTAEKDEELSVRPTYQPVSSEKIIPQYVTMDEWNTCVLDFAAYRFNGGEWQAPLEVLKIDRRIRETVGIEHRSGEMLQPWYAGTHDVQNYGDLELSFTFYVDEQPKKSCLIAMERPELFTITLNGKQLVCKHPDDFWIDICFKKLYFPLGLLRQGKNEIRMTTAFKRTTNIEAIYLVGEFGVKTKGNIVTLTEMPKTIGLGDLREYTLPFYTGQISYRITYAQLPELEPGQRLFLRTPHFKGCLVKVGATAYCVEKQVVAWAPYEVDVTKIVENKQDLIITLVPSRRNLFGPLHLYPAISYSVYPELFVSEGDAWRDEYCLSESCLGDIELLIKQQENQQ